MKQNPFQFGGKWWWTDEVGRQHGPYDRQLLAVQGLMEYFDPTSIYERVAISAFLPWALVVVLLLKHYGVI